MGIIYKLWGPNQFLRILNNTRLIASIWYNGAYDIKDSDIILQRSIIPLEFFHISRELISEVCKCSVNSNEIQETLDMLENDIKKVEYSKAIIDNGITFGISWLVLEYEFKLIFNTGECTLFSITTNVYDCCPNRELMWWKKDSLKKIRFILEFFEKNDKFIYCRRIEIEKFSRDEILIREEKSRKKLLQKITLSPAYYYIFLKNLLINYGNN